MTTSYDIDTNWYTDTVATDHITGELDQVHTANDVGMRIDRIGQSFVHTPN